MRHIKLTFAALLVLAIGAFAFVSTGTVSALDPGAPLADVCQTDPGNSVCQSQDDSAEDLIDTLINTLLFIVGALSVIMIIVGGVFYAISNGDAGKVTKAKNTILYAVVGLVVSFIAFALVNWIIVDVF